MTILSAQSIRRLCTPEGGITTKDGRVGWSDEAYLHEMITPFVERGVERGRSYGLGPCSYDIRVKSFIDYDGKEVDRVRMENGDFFLAVAMERICMPHNLSCVIRDKSSWAREGLSVFNTHTDPGFEGYLTLELSFKRRHHSVVIQAGDPIAQLVFEKLDYITEMPYKGKYQNQPDRPVDAIMEK